MTRLALALALSLAGCTACTDRQPIPDAAIDAAPADPGGIMPALTISSVDATANTLTITAHGLNTGDGPGTMFTATGTLPTTSPAGQAAAVTDTWVIKVDANTIKLATSSSNAMASTSIDFTSTGSGTLKYLVGLPYRRARTYAVGSQLKSADLNAFQDSHVALWNLLTNQQQSVFSGLVRPIALHALGGTVHSNWSPVTLTSNFDASLASTGAGYFTLVVPLQVGEYISSVDYQAFGNASANVTVTAHYLDQSITDNSLGTTTISPAASWAMHSLTCTQTPILTATAVMLVFAASASGIQIGSVTAWAGR